MIELLTPEEARIVTCKDVGEVKRNTDLSGSAAAFNQYVKDNEGTGITTTVMEVPSPIDLPYTLDFFKSKGYKAVIIGQALFIQW